MEDGDSLEELEFERADVSRVRDGRDIAMIDLDG
jgi:hypothetical protein